jgi:hypothetical protein
VLTGFFFSFQFQVPHTAAAPVTKLISETDAWQPSSLPSFEFPKMSFQFFFLCHVFIVRKQKINKKSHAQVIFKKNRNNGFVLVDDY